MRRLGALIGVTMFLVLIAPAAGQLPPTDQPLPGSTFQGADGDQDDASDAIDWESLVASDRVRHGADPNRADSAFAGGSKEERPGDWDLTTESGGVNPDKSNIRDVWGSVDQPGADTFLYLAMMRQASTGTSFLTFELNRDDRLWNNGKARIPCRRTGDVQVSFEPQGKGVDVVIRTWTTTKADATTSCAVAGELRTFAAVQANVDAQGAMNAAAITSRLAGAIKGSVPAGRFGEAALNLARLVDEAFDDDCLAFNSFWAHSRSSDSISSALQDYVAPRALRLRTCSASGVKFFDSDADGRRDPGEPGIPRFQIWADYDDDGVLDANEPFSVSDNRGRYVILGIRPPDGTYRLRERLLRGRSAALPVALDWTCSYPGTTAPGGRFPCAWGPIDSAATPNVTGRDFGNWFPARLTVRKRLFPAGDTGRFDLLVGDQVVVAAGGDRSGGTLSLPPGTYSVAERPAAGTSLADYRSAVACRASVAQFPRLRPGTTFDGIALTAGAIASCTFFNLRPGQPAIAISKRGPAVATAGDTLRYGLLVTNPGDVSFPRSAITVTDPDCDAPPVRVSTQGDTTPGTLDPGDEWRYGCTRATAAGGAACVPSRIPNGATVTGTAGGATVEDEDEISTVLTCPDVPVPPLPPDPPGPQPPAPPGPPPPPADDSGVAGLTARQQGCISTVGIPRVTVVGNRIERLRVSVDGRFAGSFEPPVLRRVGRARVDIAPGRHRVTVRVIFEPGSDTAPVTISRVIRICARPGTACPASDPQRSRAVATCAVAVRARAGRP